MMSNLIKKRKYKSKLDYNNYKLQETSNIEKLLDSPALHWERPEIKDPKTYQSRIGGPKKDFDKIINSFTMYCLKNKNSKAIFGQSDFYNSLRFKKETPDKIYYDVIPGSIIWEYSGYRQFIYKKNNL